MKKTNIPTKKIDHIGAITCPKCEEQFMYLLKRKSGRLVFPCCGKKSTGVLNGVTLPIMEEWRLAERPKEPKEK